MIDISPFCVRFDKVAPDKIRLCVHVAPGFGGALAQALRKYGARRKNGGAAVVAVPASMYALGVELGLPGPLCEGLQRYKEAWVGANHGYRVDSNRMEARIKAVEAVLGFEGGLYSSHHPETPI